MFGEFRRIGFQNFIRLIIVSRLVKLVRLRILDRSEPKYEQIDDGLNSIKSLYRDFDGSRLAMGEQAILPVGLWEMGGVRVVMNTKFSAVLQKGDLLLTPRTEPGPYHLYENQKWSSKFQIFGPLKGHYLIKEPRERL
jgi:hypothetical protein